MSPEDTHVIAFLGGSLCLLLAAGAMGGHWWVVATLGVLLMVLALNK